ncbi:MAG: cytochrome c [Chloroflexi bacterium]|nr:cytochrome c [Chloroflexota bacterium]
MHKHVLVGIIVGLSAILAACSSAAPAAAPTVEPTTAPESTPTAEAQAEPMSLGHELFIAKGCSACHGQDAEGTVIAPALTGHTMAQVRRQVRAPLGIMPVFPPDKISNEELEEIAMYIGGLGGGHAHMSGAVTPGEVVLHHWMTLSSIEADNVPEAIHHLGHIIELTEGQHRSQMEKTITLLNEGSVEEGTRIVEQMLAGLEHVEMDESSIHLTLALSAASVEQIDVAESHVEHFLEAAEGEDLEAAEHIISLLHDGEIHDAVDALENLLGSEATDEHDADADADADHDDDDDHDEDEDEHDDNS